MPLKLTCLSPGTSLTISPLPLTQTMCGIGVPRAWHTISVPVVLEKSTWFGGSWINTGPDVSDWPRTEMVRKMNDLNYYRLCSDHSSVIVHSSPIILPIISCSPAIRSSRICRGLAMTASAVRARGRVVSISSNHTLFCDIAWKWIKWRSDMCLRNILRSHSVSFE